MALRHNRPYQLLVWGATGYTGRLLCRQLVQAYGSQLRWAMAGRNRFKLIELQRELAAEFGPAASTPSSPSAISMVVASLDDKATIDAMVSEAQVVVNLVAPYTTTGTPIVDACVRLGTHYVDLAGELPWVRAMMCAYHEAAALNSVKVVHTAGVASLPFDLGAFLVAHHVVHELGGRCTHIRALTLPASQEHAALTALRPPLWASQQEDAGADAGAFAAAPAGVVVSGTTTAAVPSPAPPRPVAADAVTETVAIKKQHRPLATAADAIAAARAHGKSSTSPLAPRVVPPSLSLTSLLPGAIWWRRRSSTADTASDATRGASDCGGGGAAAMTSTTRLSGGSAASLMAMYLHTPTRQLWSLLTDPYLLLPDVREMAAGDEAGHLAGLLPAGAEEELQRLFEARRIAEGGAPAAGGEGQVGTTRELLPASLRRATAAEALLNGALSTAAAARRRAAADSSALADPSFRLLPDYDPQLRLWLVPSPFEFLNGRVVRRSISLLHRHYLQQTAAAAPATTRPAAATSAAAAAPSDASPAGKPGRLSAQTLKPRPAAVALPMVDSVSMGAADVTGGAASGGRTGLAVFGESGVAAAPQPPVVQQASSGGDIRSSDRTTTGTSPGGAAAATTPADAVAAAAPSSSSAQTAATTAAGDKASGYTSKSLLGPAGVVISGPEAAKIMHYEEYAGFDSPLLALLALLFHWAGLAMLFLVIVWAPVLRPLLRAFYGLLPLPARGEGAPQRALKGPGKGWSIAFLGTAADVIEPTPLAVMKSSGTTSSAGRPGSSRTAGGRWRRWPLGILGDAAPSAQQQRRQEPAAAAFPPPHASVGSAKTPAAAAAASGGGAAAEPSGPEVSTPAIGGGLLRPEPAEQSSTAIAMPSELQQPPVTAEGAQQFTVAGGPFVAAAAPKVYPQRVHAPMPVRVAAAIGDPLREPGYLSTTRMALETALGLVLDRDDVKERHGYLPDGGVLTPAAALGPVLVRRLRAAGYDIRPPRLLSSITD